MFWAYCILVGRRNNESESLIKLLRIDVCVSHVFCLITHHSLLKWHCFKPFSSFSRLNGTVGEHLFVFLLISYSNVSYQKKKKKRLYLTSCVILRYIFINFIWIFCIPQKANAIIRLYHSLQTCNSNKMTHSCLSYERLFLVFFHGILLMCIWAHVWNLQ